MSISVTTNVTDASRTDVTDVNGVVRQETRNFDVRIFAPDAPGDYPVVFWSTSWVAERPLGWVAGCAIRLFVLAFVASVSIGFVDTLPAAFTLDAGGVLNVFLFGLTVLALAWFAPMLASEVVQGQPNLSGSDAVRTGVGTTFTTIGGAFVLNRGLKSAKRFMIGVSGGRPRRMGGGRGGGAAPRPASVNYAAMRPRAQSPRKSS